MLPRGLRLRRGPVLSLKRNYRRITTFEIKRLGESGVDIKQEGPRMVFITKTKKKDVGMSLNLIWRQGGALHPFSLLRQLEKVTFQTLMGRTSLFVFTSHPS